MEGQRRVDSGAQEASSILGQIVEPWYRSLANPGESQDATLTELLQGYRKTRYGRERGAESTQGIQSFRERFPISDYQSLSSYIDRVASGEYDWLLPEPPKAWVMTRGSTGKSKVLPATDTHLSLILSMGARAVVNFALRSKSDVLETPVLNLNFPSRVHEGVQPGAEGSYGYSSGTYARLFPELQGARLVPSQDEIDALGGGISKGDWDRRFELVYSRARDEDVGSLMGVTPVMLSFASYVRSKHGVRPRDFWRPRALFCTSVAKIQTRYAPELKFHFGASPIVEMYTATEGVFGQQLDGNPYISPNYDGYLFEVETGSGVRMLHELRPNEWGRIVVSTPLFPRYAIGDLVEAVGKGYFRIFGRDRLATRIEHRAFNLVAFRH